MPRGGKRQGAGRKPGSRNALPLGTVAAIRAGVLAERRLGTQKVEPEAKAALERAMERVADVLEERVHFTAAGGVLKAAAIVADTVAGPQAQKVQHDAGPTLSQLLVEAHKRIAAEKPGGGS